MLSFGSAAFTEDGNLVSTFSANLETLSGATGDPDTMKWWTTQPEAWKACRENLLPPGVAMRKYVGWLKGLPGKPVFVGYPAGFDFLFIYWYLIMFAKESPFSFSAIDIKTYAMAVLQKPYRESTKRNMPKHWFSKAPHTHVALDDAIEQGQLFCAMLKGEVSNLDHDELADMLRRRARLEAKELAHRHAGRLDDLAYDLAYVEGLADSLAILQGREPSRPDPVR